MPSDYDKLQDVFPTGVTVVVSVHTPDGSVHGMTTSSFFIGFFNAPFGVVFCDE